MPIDYNNPIPSMSELGNSLRFEKDNNTKTKNNNNNNNRKNKMNNNIYSIDISDDETEFTKFVTCDWATLGGCGDTLCVGTENWNFSDMVPDMQNMVPDMHNMVPDMQKMVPDMQSVVAIDWAGFPVCKEYFHVTDTSSTEKNMTSDCFSSEDDDDDEIALKSIDTIENARAKLTPKLNRTNSNSNTNSNPMDATYNNREISLEQHLSTKNREYEKEKLRQQPSRNRETKQMKEEEKPKKPYERTTRTKQQGSSNNSHQGHSSGSSQRLEEGLGRIKRQRTNESISVGDRSHKSNRSRNSNTSRNLHRRRPPGSSNTNNKTPDSALRRERNKMIRPRSDDDDSPGTNHRNSSRSRAEQQQRSLSQQRHHRSLSRSSSHQQEQPNSPSSTVVSSSTCSRERHGRSVRRRHHRGRSKENNRRDHRTIQDLPGLLDKVKQNQEILKFDTNSQTRAFKQRLMRVRHREQSKASVPKQQQQDNNNTVCHGKTIDDGKSFDGFASDQSFDDIKSMTTM